MKKYKLDQSKIPIYDTLIKYSKEKIIPFCVPGHKMGQGVSGEWRAFLGEHALSADLTLLEPVEDALEKAQELAAEVFHADHTLFSVNGTSGAIQAMIMSVVNQGEKIIVPRNMHKSILAGLVLSGADPIYMIPEYDECLGLTQNVSVDTLKETLQLNQNARAVLITNPSYNGICANLKEIARLVHSYGIPLLVDEAHGSHLQFHPEVPPSAMDCGADISAQSTHKNLSSLTQSSMLHIKEGLVDIKKVKRIMAAMQTTSPSGILMMSLDWARYQMAENGYAELDRILQISKSARNKVNHINGFYCVSEEMIKKDGKFTLDETKITVGNDLGITGTQLEQLLLNQYKIQVDCSELKNIICFFTIGDKNEDIEKFCDALVNIAKEHDCKTSMRTHTYVPAMPVKKLTPREAFFAPTCLCKLKDSAGKISGESVMLYPPGIPILSPGEIISEEMIQYIMILKEEKMNLVGLEYLDQECIKIIDN